MNHRCVICNKVSNEMIETNIGDTTDAYFKRDYKNSEDFICGECVEVIEDTLVDYTHSDTWEEFTL